MRLQFLDSSPVGRFEEDAVIYALIFHILLGAQRPSTLVWVGPTPTLKECQGVLRVEQQVTAIDMQQSGMLDESRCLALPEALQISAVYSCSLIDEQVIDIGRGPNNPRQSAFKCSGRRSSDSEAATEPLLDVARASASTVQLAADADASAHSSEYSSAAATDSSIIEIWWEQAFAHDVGDVSTSNIPWDSGAAMFKNAHSDGYRLSQLFASLVRLRRLRCDSISDVTSLLRDHGWAIGCDRQNEAYAIKLVGREWKLMVEWNNITQPLQVLKAAQGAAAQSPSSMPTTKAPVRDASSKPAPIQNPDYSPFLTTIREKGYSCESITDVRRIDSYWRVTCGKDAYVVADIGGGRLMAQRD